MATLPKFRSDRPCVACPLGEQGCHKMQSAGNRDAKILVVTAGARSEDAARVREFLSSGAMKVFKRAMGQNGFKSSDFVWQPAVRCYYDKETRPTREKTDIQTQCREYLLRIIEQMQPEIIIPLGVEAARSVYGKAKKITKIRGAVEWDEDYNAWIYPMIDPTQVAMYPQNWGVFRADARGLRRLIETDFNEELVARDGLGNYEIIDDLQFLIDAADRGEFTDIVIDTETEGTRWADPEKRLLTVQFCIEPGTAYLLSWDHPDSVMDQRTKRKIRRQMRELLCRREINVIGQNLKFDVNWIYTRMGVRIKIGEDTLMMAAILDENNKSKDMSTLVKIFVPEMAGYDDLFNRTYDKSKMHEVPLDKIVEYGCGDTDACFRLAEVFWAMLEEDPTLLDYYYNVSIPGLNAFADVERRGMIIHEARLDELREEVAQYVEDLEASLLNQIPRSIKREHIAKGIKLSRKDLILDVLFDHPDGFNLIPHVYTKTTEKLAPELRVPSTSSKNHLPFFFDECPFTEELAEWMKLNRLLGTSIDKFRENYMIGDMVYPSYQMHVTVTGRTSSQDPNGQNFPKRGKFAKPYRKIFIPPPDMYMLEADLSQAELRIAADMSGDETMIEIYNNNGDIHRTTALIVTGLTAEQFAALPPDEQGLARFKAKAVNFGFIYGMGWRKFIIYAKTQYDVEFTPREAERIRDEFFRRYPRLVRWHRSMRTFAQNNGYVRSYSGRVRHLPMIYSDTEYIRNEAQRQAINSPVQEFGSTLGVLAMIDIAQEIDPQYLAMTGFVHDALFALVPKQYAEWGAKTLKRYMENVDLEGLFNRTMKVPILADVSIGENGGEQFEMPGLDLEVAYDWESLLDYKKEDDDGNALPFPLEGFPEQIEPPEGGLIELPDYMKYDWAA